MMPHSFGQDIPPSWASLRYFSRLAGRQVVLIQSRPAGRGRAAVILQATRSARDSSRLWPAIVAAAAAINAPTSIEKAAKNAAAAPVLRAVSAAWRSQPRRPDREGVIEIAFGCGARVRLRGEVSSETLRQVIELLR
jgi:hypothetical protein